MAGRIRVLSRNSSGGLVGNRGKKETPESVKLRFPERRPFRREVIGGKQIEFQVDAEIVSFR